MLSGQSINRVKQYRSNLIVYVFISLSLIKGIMYVNQAYLNLPHLGHIAHLLFMCNYFLNTIV